MPYQSGEYLTTRAVARILGISSQTLYNWMNEGKVPRPDRNPITQYPRWKPEDVDRIRALITGGQNE